MKKSELKQLIKEQISLIGYVDQKSINTPIHKSAINSLMKNKIVKESTISESYIKDQLMKILYTADDQSGNIKIKVTYEGESSELRANTNWLNINKEQLEAIIKIFE